MANVNILNWNKEKVGQVELRSDVFEVEFKKELLHSVVRWQLASRRQGTHMTKTKGLVSGGGKKPFKQKGTGNARQGSTRSPLMPGGGTTFGPQPRDYSYVLPKKVKRLALSVALSHLLKEGKLFVLDSMKSDGKTNGLVKNVAKLGLTKTILVDKAENILLKRAAGNARFVKYLPVEGLNVFDLLKYENVVLSADSLEGVVSKCLVEKV